MMSINVSLAERYNKIVECDLCIIKNEKLLGE